MILANSATLKLAIASPKTPPEDVELVKTVRSTVPIFWIGQTIWAFHAPNMLTTIYADLDGSCPGLADIPQTRRAVDVEVVLITIRNVRSRQELNVMMVTTVLHRNSAQTMANAKGRNVRRRVNTEGACKSWKTLRVVMEAVVRRIILRLVTAMAARARKLIADFVNVTVETAIKPDVTIANVTVEAVVRVVVQFAHATEVVATKPLATTLHAPGATVSVLAMVWTAAASNASTASAPQLP